MVAPGEQQQPLGLARRGEKFLGDRVGDRLVALGVQQEQGDLARQPSDVLDKALFFEPWREALAVDLEPGQRLGA